MNKKEWPIRRGKKKQKTELPVKERRCPQSLCEDTRALTATPDR